MRIAITKIERCYAQSKPSGKMMESEILVELDRVNVRLRISRETIPRNIGMEHYPSVF